MDAKDGGRWAISTQNWYDLVCNLWSRFEHSLDIRTAISPSLQVTPKTNKIIRRKMMTVHQVEKSTIGLFWLVLNFLCLKMLNGSVLNVQEWFFFLLFFTDSDFSISSFFFFFFWIFIPFKLHEEKLSGLWGLSTFSHSHNSSCVFALHIKCTHATCLVYFFCKLFFGMDFFRILLCLSFTVENN